MIGLLLLKVLTAAASIGLAAGILARDPGFKANRLMAVFLVCNGGGASFEFAILQTRDPWVALQLYRWMALCWIPLGVLCAQASFKLTALGQTTRARWIPISYVAIALFMPFAIGTDWVIAGVVPGSVGWHPEFGPGMGVAYGLHAAPLVAVLIRWRRVLEYSSEHGELKLAQITFFGFSLAFVVGTVTAILLPILGVEFIGMTTSMIAAIGIAVTHTLRRYGYSVLSPETFAREILDTLEDGVVLVGDGGVIRDANRAFLRMVGAEEISTIGRPIKRFIPDFPRGPESVTVAALMQLETHERRAIPILVSPSFKMTERVRRIGHAFLVRDRREVSALQKKLVLSARLASVGDLSRSISQAIDEPITSMREELDALSHEWLEITEKLTGASDSDAFAEATLEGSELIAECVEGGQRIGAIVGEVADFSGDQSGEAFARHPLDEIVDRAIRVASVRAPSGFEIETRTDSAVWIRCRRTQIERVATNLIVNALDALEAQDEKARHLVVGLASGQGRAFLHVEDNGIGIESAKLDRIFDPFFTTKPVGKGTGLGLAISYHVVKAHGGEIRVSSVKGRGTSVVVELPLMDPI